jgi:threonine dehydrogenase-like Zn-dependent dehydrogenase
MNPSSEARSDGLPAEMRALVLDGTGFDHLRVRNVPTPSPGPGQLLARVDAAGICTSLIKLVEQGPDHKFVYGWDLARFPLILGDEGSVTLVEIGEDLRDRYCPGQRFVVQPAVDHAPINNLERYRDRGQGIGKVAVGYTLPGHLAEYMLITEEVLAAGCLLPLPGSGIPHAHAALSEPFSCAVSAQQHHTHLLQRDPLSPREVVNGLRRDGVTLIVGAGAMGRMHVDLALGAGPRTIVVADLLEERLELVRTLFGRRAAACGIELRTVNPASADLAAAIGSATGGAGADDVIVAAGSRPAIEKAQALVARGGVLNLFGGLKKGEEVVGFDTGIVHYREINITGSSGGGPWDVARTLELMAARTIDAGVHIACIGDLEHAIDFLRMTKAQAIAGKAVVYPHRCIASIRGVKSWTAQDETDYLR